MTILDKHIILRHFYPRVFSDIFIRLGASGVKKFQRLANSNYSYGKMCTNTSVIIFKNYLFITIIIYFFW